MIQDWGERCVKQRGRRTEEECGELGFWAEGRFHFREKSVQLNECGNVLGKRRTVALN